MKVCMLMKNYVFHKHAQFIEELLVKIEESAFKIFTLVWDFPKELYKYGPSNMQLPVNVGLNLYIKGPRFTNASKQTFKMWKWEFLCR